MGLKGNWVAEVFVSLSLGIAPATGFLRAAWTETRHSSSMASRSVTFDTNTWEVPQSPDVRPHGAHV